MPSRVGHITELNEDGTVRIRNEITNEEWYGRLIVMSGGMICFDVVDERLAPVNGVGYEPENGEAPAHARTESGIRTRVGPKKKEVTEEPVPAA